MGKGTVIIRTQPQREFTDSKSPDVAAVAGVGSGKTGAIILDIIKGMQRYPYNDFAYLAPNYGLIRSIFYPRIIEVFSQMGMKIKRDYNINKSEHEISVRGHGKILCRTMDNPEMIVGWEAFRSYPDEIDVLTEQKAEIAYNKISARTRQKARKKNGDFYKKSVAKRDHPNQKKIATTPEGFKFTYEKFKKNPIEGSHLIQMSTYSNQANLPEDYIENLIKQYPEQLVNAYILGKFVNLQTGTVYYAFDRDRHHSSFTGLKKGDVLQVGMDFNVWHMAAAISVLREYELTAEDILRIPNNGKIYFPGQRVKRLHFFDEIIDGRDTQDVCSVIKERYPDNSVIVYPDPAGKNASSKGYSDSDVKILKQNGFRVKVMNSHPLVRDRVLSYNNAIEQNLIVFDTRLVPEISEAMEKQVYKNGIPDKANDYNHILDGAGYKIFHFNPVVNNIIKTARI